MADITADLAGFNLQVGSSLCNVLFVDPCGDNDTAELGNIDKPWADPWAAASSADATEGSTIFMFNGDYDGSSYDQVLATNNNMVIVGNGSTLSNPWMIAGADQTITDFQMYDVNIFAPRFTLFRPRGGYLNWVINLPSVIYNPVGPTYFTFMEDNGQVADIGPASYGSVDVNIGYMEGGFYLLATQTDLSNTEPFNIAFDVGVLYKNPPDTNPQSRGLILMFDCTLLRCQINVGTAWIRQVVWGLSYFGQSSSTDCRVDLNIGVLDYLTYETFGSRGGLFFAEYGGAAKPDILYNITIKEGTIENDYLFGGSGWANAKCTIRETKINCIDPTNSGVSNFGLLELNIPGVDLTFLNTLIECDDQYTIQQSIPNNSQLTVINSDLFISANNDMFDLISNTGIILARYSSFRLNDSTQNVITSTVVRVDSITQCVSNAVAPFTNVINVPIALIP